MHTNIHTYIQACMHACMHVHKRTCMHACMHTYTYIHTHIRAYIHTHAHIHSHCTYSYMQIQHTGVRPLSFPVELAALEVPLEKEVPLDGVDLAVGDGEAIAADMVANSSVALVAFSVRSYNKLYQCHVNHT